MDASLDVIVAMFGANVTVAGADAGGCYVDGASGSRVRFHTSGERAVDVPRPRTSGPALSAPTGPFTFRAFGDTNRLAWQGGGRSVIKRARVVFWEERWAAVVDTSSITVIDGVMNREAQLVTSLYTQGRGCAVGGDRLWLGGDQCVHVIETAQLEAVPETKARELAAVKRPIYPLRDSGAATEAKVVWMLHDEEALVNFRSAQIRIHGKYGLEKGMQLVMHDERLPGRFAFIEVVDTGKRIALFEADAVQPFTIKIVRTRSKDPAAHTPAITATDPRLEPLLAELARDPDNAANRLVLVDLLQELGESFGAWVAEGEGKAERRDALGPLAHYLDRLEYRGGLPWAARLVHMPPLDEDIVAQAVDDLRLGMLTTLRMGVGPREIYGRLVGSPRAIGLRRVDAHERGIVEALIAAGRTQLTHLYDVRFTKTGFVKLLADPTFDRVVEIETVIQRRHLETVLGRIEDDVHGLFARAPRTLVLRERNHNDLDLLEPALARFDKLPLAELVVAGVIVRRRDGDIEVETPPEQEATVRRVLPLARIHCVTDGERR